MPRQLRLVGVNDTVSARFEVMLLCTLHDVVLQFTNVDSGRNRVHGHGYRCCRLTSTVSADGLTIEQITSLLEDTTDVVKATIFMEPPVNALQSDEDSDDDDPSGNINKLFGNQIRPGAELICEKITENGIENFRYGYNCDTYDEDIVPGTPEKTPSRFSF
ncbi:hypothetical protein J6590_065311 [Homalodisca vitripennis]|nr:hypothetical protein J6590_065311 [Homalodisca vitripennis]